MLNSKLEFVIKIPVGFGFLAIFRAIELPRCSTEVMFIVSGMDSPDQGDPDLFYSYFAERFSTMNKTPLPRATIPLFVVNPCENMS